MSIFYIHDDACVQSRYVKNSSNSPEKRAKLIHEELTRLGIHGLQNSDLLSQKVLDELNVHSSEYVSFLENAYDSAVRHNDPDWFDNGELIPNHFLNFNSQAIYYNARANLPLYKLSGYYGNDIMSPILKTTYKNAMKSSANTYLATDIASKDMYKVIYALNSSPGHHATNHGYSGYCFLNNGAISAKRFQQLGYDKVCVLDLDYHAGNGAQDIFYEDPTVLTVSIHGDPRVEYPSFSGFEDEKGSHKGLGYNLNLPLGKGTSWKEYSSALQTALEKIRSFNPDAFVIAFGADTYKEDPDACKIAGFKLEIEDYPKMGNIIRECIPNIPIVVTQEGGYCLEHVPTIVSSFLLALAGK